MDVTVRSPDVFDRSRLSIPLPFLPPRRKGDRNLDPGFSLSLFSVSHTSSVFQPWIGVCLQCPRPNPSTLHPTLQYGSSSRPGGPTPSRRPHFDLGPDPVSVTGITTATRIRDLPHGSRVPNLEPSTTRGQKGWTGVGSGGVCFIGKVKDWNRGKVVNVSK